MTKSHDSRILGLSSSTTACATCRATFCADGPYGCSGALAPTDGPRACVDREYGCTRPHRCFFHGTSRLFVHMRTLPSYPADGSSVSGLVPETPASLAIRAAAAIVTWHTYDRVQDVLIGSLGRGFPVHDAVAVPASLTPKTWTAKHRNPHNKLNINLSELLARPLPMVDYEQLEMRLSPARLVAEIERLKNLSPFNEESGDLQDEVEWDTIYKKGPADVGYGEDDGDATEELRPETLDGGGDAGAGPE